MSSAAVREGFTTALGAAFPTLPVVPVENLPSDPPKDTNGRLVPFLATFFLATEQALSIGRNCFRESGTINVMVYALAGRGVDDSVATADAIRDRFAYRDLPVVAPGVRFALKEANPLTAYLGRSGAPTGAFYVGMVAVSYDFDFYR